MKRKVKIDSTRSFIIWLIVLVVFALAILRLINIIDISDKISDLEKLPSSALTNELVESTLSTLKMSLVMNIASLIFEVLVCVLLVKLTIVVEYNRDYIIDTVNILNETEIIEKGMKTVQKDDDFMFQTSEFGDLVDKNEDNFCRCGCQLYENDEYCPNCGRKLKNDKKD